MNTGIDLETIARWLIAAGVGLVVMGGLLIALRRIGGFENLPGTIRWQSGGITCVVPVALSIVLSIALTIILNLLARGVGK